MISISIFYFTSKGLLSRLLNNHHFTFIAVFVIPVDTFTVTAL